jgi:hypothetical protein
VYVGRVCPAGVRVPPLQIPTQNGEIKVLFYKFHRRINLMVFCFIISGSGTKLRTQNLEIWKSCGPFVQSLKFEGLLRVGCNMWKIFTRPTCVSDFFKFIYLKLSTN